MGRKVIYHNYRVEVEPKDFTLSTFGGSEHKQRVQQIHGLRNEIVRHVGDVVCRATFDAQGICEFCGRYWTEGVYDPHNGGCCDQDAANMPEESEAAS